MRRLVERLTKPIADPGCCIVGPHVLCRTLRSSSLLPGFLMTVLLGVLKTGKGTAGTCDLCPDRSRIDRFNAL